MICGKIRDITPDAQYQGTVYTQTLDVELADGTAIQVFDPTVPTASEDDVGRRVALEIVVHANDIARANPDRNDGIFPQGEDIEIIGRAGETPDQEDRDSNSPLEVEVAGGSIYVDMSEEHWREFDAAELTPGDPVYVLAYMINLRDLKSSDTID